MSFTIDDVIESARARTGNRKNTIQGEQYASDDAITAELQEAIDECTEAFGASSSLEEVSFSVVANPSGTYFQTYDIPTYVGTDVERIVEVLRSDAYVSDAVLQPQQIDPRTGVPTTRAAFVDQAYQQDVMDEMVAMARWRRIQEFDWEVVSIGGSPSIRLMPPPAEQCIVYVRYLSTGENASTLPDEARPALEYAACCAILNISLNQINSQPSAMQDPENYRTWKFWIDALIKQRDRYDSKFRQALSKRPRN